MESATLAAGTNRRRTASRWMRRAASLCAVMLAFSAAPAWASPLDDAKRAGHLGERGDGYVGLVDPSAPESAQAVMRDVNQKRRAQYQKIAESNGVPVEAVASQAGQKLVERAGAGEYVRSGGKWVKR
jgi:uncharacterized protein YdbL (DUF1318 family)